MACTLPAGQSENGAPEFIKWVVDLLSVIVLVVDLRPTLTCAMAE